MSLKAGRVGVNPEDVNPVNGKIQVEAPDNVYTKTQADNKFETKSHASSTYETKADATNLQPKTLAVPISMLNGSSLEPISMNTVESVFAGMDNALTNKALTDLVGLKTGSVTATVTEGATITDSAYVISGHVCFVYLKIRLTDVLADGSRINLTSTNLKANALGKTIFGSVYQRTGVYVFIKDNGDVALANLSGTGISNTEIQCSFSYPV